VRAVSHHPDGYHIALDRVVDALGTLINKNPATYPYIVPDNVIQEETPIVVGDLVELTTNGVRVTWLNVRTR